MLLKMIAVAQQNADVMAVLQAKKAAFSDKKDVQTKVVLTVLCNAAVNTASIIDEHINDKEIVITTNSEKTVVLDNKYKQVKYSIKALEKAFRVKREFTGTWGEATEAYRQYADTHNVGERWNEGDVVCCYEYLLESKGEYEQQQIEAAQQVAEEASSTAEFLGGDRLVGTPKQQAWAEQIRAEVLVKADKKQAAKLLQQLSAKWWIDNKGLSVAELAKKRITQAKQVQEKLEKPAEQHAEFTLADSQRLIVEKLAQFGETRIKADLYDACLGNKARAESIFNGTAKLTASELKSFMQYAQ